MLQIDDQNGNIAQARSSRAEITEALMAWSINDKQSWNVDINLIKALAFTYLLNQLILREESSTDLLGYTSGLTLLNVCMTNLI